MAIDHPEGLTWLEWSRWAKRIVEGHEQGAYDLRAVSRVRVIKWLLGPTGRRRVPHGPMLTECIRLAQRRLEGLDRVR